jgi:hypothetical protein
VDSGCDLLKSYSLGRALTYPRARQFVKMMPKTGDGKTPPPPSLARPLVAKVVRRRGLRLRAKIRLFRSMGDLAGEAGHALQAHRGSKSTEHLANIDHHAACGC